MDGGFGLLIPLPTLRVIVVFIVYFRRSDYHLSAIGLSVLTIILLGFAVGLREASTAIYPGFPTQVRGKALPPHAIQAISPKSNCFLTAAACFSPAKLRLRRFIYEYNYKSYS
jgi:hypothetical protein